jgi:hypothetical protein
VAGLAAFGKTGVLWHRTPFSAFPSALRQLEFSAKIAGSTSSHLTLFHVVDFPPFETRLAFYTGGSEVKVSLFQMHSLDVGRVYGTAGESLGPGRRVHAQPAPCPPGLCSRLTSVLSPLKMKQAGCLVFQLCPPREPGRGWIPSGWNLRRAVCFPSQEACGCWCSDPSPGHTPPLRQAGSKEGGRSSAAWTNAGETGRNNRLKIRTGKTQ